MALVLDHLIVRVKDAAATVAFWTEILGAEQEDSVCILP